MSEMLERAAKALAVDLYGPEPLEKEEFYKSAMEMCRNDARLALLAALDPEDGEIEELARAKFNAGRPDHPQGAWVDLLDDFARAALRNDMRATIATLRQRAHGESGE